MRSKRGARWVVVGAVTAVPLALADGGGTAGAAPTPPPQVSGTAAPAPVLAAAASTAPAPTPAGVATALAGPLAAYGMGATPHVSVVDVSTGSVLLDRAAAAPAIPASTTKLVTAAAALTVLGPQTRLATRVLRSGPDLYLVGGGDPLLASTPGPGGYPAPADLVTLATATARRMGGGPVGTVYAVGSRYTGPDLAPGWSASYLTDGEIAPVRSLLVDEAKLVPSPTPGVRAADPLAAAATAFRSALTRAGVGGSGTAVAAAAPASATPVAAVTGPPVSALVERMLDYSDSDVAEGLGRQVALRLGLPATFGGTAEALSRTAARLGLPLTAPAGLVDASGLSRADALSPAWLTALLRAAATGDRPALRLLPGLLPVAGYSGTLTLRFSGSDAGGAGVVRAKTGWLNGAAALAGYVTTRDGRLLAFAALVPAPDRGSGEAALDRLAATLAACGCR